MNEIAYLFSGFLGKYKHFSHNGKLSFDCPNCNDGKGNLDIDLNTQFYSCWACWDDGGVWGKNPYNLIKKYAGYDWQNIWVEYKRLLETLDIKIPEFKSNHVFIEGYSIFDSTTKNKYKHAYDYLIRRGISDDMINNYKIGYCTYGRYQDRIICPSISDEGFNYFVGRAIDNNPIRYLADSVDKKCFFFNEKLIDYFSPIVLVEGVFDHYSCANSIPLLGKSISDWQINRLQDMAKNNIYIAMDKNAKKEAEQIATKLNWGALKGNIYIIHMEEKDFSDMLPKIGHIGVMNYIKEHNKQF